MLKTFTQWIPSAQQLSFDVLNECQQGSLKNPYKNLSKDFSRNYHASFKISNKSFFQNSSEDFPSTEIPSSVLPMSLPGIFAGFSQWNFHRIPTWILSEIPQIFPEQIKRNPRLILVEL